ncbi:MAG TPA: hypothetical protein VJW20_02530 [Candidatus Angelobacter sp.]|nr:hypothetical protein [Candidatus Angelobacter sp.]
MRAKVLLFVTVLVIAGLAACRKEVIHASDDPSTVVRDAEAKFAQDFNHRCQMENSGNSGPGWQDHQVYEVAAPDRYRIITENRLGGELQKGEILVIKDEAYRRLGDGAWQKMDPRWMGYLKKTGGPPMPISSAIGYRIDPGSVKFAGNDRVDGETTLRYEMNADNHVEMTKQIVYWVGVHDGLPHKTEERVETKSWGSAPMTSHSVMSCTFGEHLKIDAPI